MSAKDKSQYLEILHKVFQFQDSEFAAFSKKLSSFIFNNAQGDNDISHPELSASFALNDLKSLSTRIKEPILPWPDFVEMANLFAQSEFNHKDLLELPQSFGR